MCRYHIYDRFWGTDDHSGHNLLDFSPSFITLRNPIPHYPCPIFLLTPFSEYHVHTFRALLSCITLSIILVVSGWELAKCVTSKQCLLPAYDIQERVKSKRESTPDPIIYLVWYFNSTSRCWCKMRDLRYLNFVIQTSLTLAAKCHQIWSQVWFDYRLIIMRSS